MTQKYIGEHIKDFNLVMADNNDIHDNFNIGELKDENALVERNTFKKPVKMTSYPRYVSDSLICTQGVNGTGFALLDNDKFMDTFTAPLHNDA